MNFQVKIVCLSFIISVIISIIIVPILRKLKVGQIERSDGPQSHIKKQGTPTMGGIILIITLCIVIAMTYFYYVKKEQMDIAKQLIPMLIMSVMFGIVGLVDDFKKLVLKNTTGLKPSLKMLGLLIISVVYIMYLVNMSHIGTDTYIPILKQYINIPIFAYIPFAIIVILATTNAVNLTDGIDGLASSVCIIIITCLAVIGIINNVKEVVILASAVIGALLGFLIFNLHPAKVFMGDTGSLFLGGFISVLALYMKMPLLLLIIAFIPVVEALSVILQVIYFKKTGKRIFKMAPLHHHFELSGWSENKVVMLFSIITLILCVIGIQII